MVLEINSTSNEIEIVQGETKYYY